MGVTIHAHFTQLLQSAHLLARAGGRVYIRGSDLDMASYIVSPPTERPTSSWLTPNARLG
jgi:histone H3/H4